MSAVRRQQTRAAAGHFAAPASRSVGPPPHAPPTNLPAPLTPFIGREGEVAAVRQLLLDPAVRLLTLTGPAGVGKTRLALATAARSVGRRRHRYVDGVWLVELAPLADPALVAHAVAAALAPLGLRETPCQPPESSLIAALRSRELLLILDNCEHLLDACAHVATALLRACPALRILATSREPLGTAGETCWRTTPLAVPDAHGSAPPAQAEAVRLFVARARAALPGFSITERNAPAVAALCRRLDGLPLAIELAAACVRAVPAEHLLARLEQRLRLPAGAARAVPARHRTLDAAIDWSYDLLTEPERRLFERLSVFAGGFTIEAAETICRLDELDDGPQGAGRDMPHAPDVPDTLDLLARLVDTSLVEAGAAAAQGAQVPEAGTPRDRAGRYRLLETLRHYARHRLAARGEAAMLHDRHAAYYLALAESATPRGGPARREALDALEGDLDNIRAALRWALERGDAARVLRAVGPMSWFWEERAHFGEGQRWLDEALAAGAAAPPAVRARARLGAVRLALRRGALDEARAHAEACLALSREAGDPAGIADALNVLGRVAVHQADDASACAALEEGLAIGRRLDDDRLVSNALQQLGMSHLLRREPARAQALLDEAVAAARRHGIRAGLLLATWRAGLAATDRGDVAAARGLLAESAALAVEDGSWGLLAFVLEACAHVAALECRAERALRLTGAAAALRDATGDPPPPRLRSRSDRALARARRALGEAGAAAAWTQGRAMASTEAAAYVLAQPPPRTRGAGKGGTQHRDRLTAREAEVLRLLAAGKGNRQMADELVLSVRTVERHVANVYAKIGAHGRATAAAYAVRRGLH